MASKKSRKRSTKRAKKPAEVEVRSVRSLAKRFTIDAVPSTADTRDALPEEFSCRGCVEAVIRQICGPFSSIGQTLNSICAPCNVGKLSQLERALANCGRAPGTLRCSMTVRDVIIRVCA